MSQMSQNESDELILNCLAGASKVWFYIGVYLVCIFSHDLLLQLLIPKGMLFLLSVTYNLYFDYINVFLMTF